MRHDVGIDFLPATRGIFIVQSEGNQSIVSPLHDA
jgi:hypothetical protein